MKSMSTRIFHDNLTVYSPNHNNTQILNKHKTSSVLQHNFITILHSNSDEFLASRTKAAKKMKQATSAVELTMKINMEVDQMPKMPDQMASA